MTRNELVSQLNVDPGTGRSFFFSVADGDGDDWGEVRVRFSWNAEVGLMAQVELVADDPRRYTRGVSSAGRAEWALITPRPAMRLFEKRYAEAEAVVLDTGPMPEWLT